MKAVFLMQLQRLRRAPSLVLSFMVLTILFVAVMGGVGGEQKLTVYTYPGDSMTEKEMDDWLEKLNQSDVIKFHLKTESEARAAVQKGDVNIAIQLSPNDYRTLIYVDDPNRHVVENFVQQIYKEELRFKEAEAQGVSSDFREEVKSLLNEPVLSVETTSLQGENSTKFNNQIHVLFGMTLYFSIFTILFNLKNVVLEKRLGTWDRMILSPLRKWQVYLGHLLYCYMIGYAQITIIFLIFKFGFGFDLGTNFVAILVIIGCYSFAIVALGMLIMGLVRTPQQLQAVIPIVGTAMAMLGGAYWPIEIVTNELLIAASKATPILYGLEALRGIVFDNKGLLDLAQPISILLLYGVICMGIGVNLMERR